MRGRSLTITGIFAAAIAVALILCYQSISITGIAITCGILFVAIGLINMIFFGYKTKDDSSKVLTFVTDAAAIVLGLSMLVFRAEFSPMIAFMLGLLVAVCSLWQFFVLAIGARPYQLPVWLYVFPVLLAAGALYIYLKPDYAEKNDSILLLSTGICMAVLGAGCIIEGSILGMARRKDEKTQTDTEQTNTNPSVPQNQKFQNTTEVDRPTSSYMDDRPTYSTNDANYTYSNLETRRRKPETTEDLDDEIKEPNSGN